MKHNNLLIARTRARFQRRPSRICWAKSASGIVNHCVPVLTSNQVLRMSRSSQHNELRRRHGTTDYRLFAPEQYEFPERIEATEAIFDESLGFTFLNRPYLRSNNDREKWLLASMHAHCDPSQWKKGASIANTKAAYSIWFGKNTWYLQFRTTHGCRPNIKA